MTEGGRDKGIVRGRDGGRERKRDGDREGKREGEREGEREVKRERESASRVKERRLMIDVILKSNNTTITITIIV